jgi:hypothetical protein
MPVEARAVGSSRGTAFAWERGMSDDTTNRGTPDNKNISMKEEHEVRYWTKALGVTKEQLQAAVDAVGSSAAKVREHLGTKSN